MLTILNQTFDLVEMLRTAKDVGEVERCFASIATQSGACAYIICDIPPGAAPSSREIHASGWNPEWERKYLAQRYAEVDPVPNSVNSYSEPYFWHDLAAKTMQRSRAANVLHEARAEFRMHDGLCIPVHGLEGVAGLVSLASEETEWRLSGQEQAALHLLGLYAYEAVRRIKGPANQAHEARLSPRELDCIRWLAEGKTAWETSMILGVAEETVRGYIKGAARKLDTHSQAHLVARVHRLGLLH